MIKHIIFDWDNTLSITEPITFEIENIAATSLGYKPQTRKKHIRTYGMVFLDALKLRFPGADVQKIADIVINELVPKYVEEGKIDIVSERTERALRQLKEKGYKLHILTSRIPASVKHIDNPKNPQRQYFDRISDYEDTVVAKPDPRVFENLLNEIDANPNECVYVGDTASDLCAKEAGLYVIISLESGIRKKEDFDKEKVDTFIQDFSELVEGIEDLSAKI